ncbi:hypothetical protein [Clostridium sp. CCUG 7971]|uniref:hypothetical protein n=1 Tax=Clostridium sp. CCUG 7971 TaxID=2811414 RepID=UPI001ABA59DB|nr:hypothetical protein [Clostridium sp. CCUG 7971]MBO3443529.1 hypothetical protein [Clostridium sp. CCUG 7971]
MKYVSYACGYIVDIRKIDNETTFITIGKDINNIYTYITLVVSPKTLILDSECNEISITNLNIRDTVLAYHSNAMTMSIPPQTKAYIIELK